MFQSEAEVTAAIAAFEAAVAATAKETGVENVRVLCGARAMIDGQEKEYGSCWSDGERWTPERIYSLLAVDEFFGSEKVLGFAEKTIEAAGIMSRAMEDLARDLRIARDGVAQQKAGGPVL